MNPRERVLAVLSGECPDQAPINCYGLGDSIKQWLSRGFFTQENLPRETYNFCLDGSGFDASLQFTKEILHKSANGIITHIDEYGATMRYIPEYMHTPEHLDWKIKTQPDWEKHKNRLIVTKERVAKKSLEWWRQIQTEKYRLFVICVPGIFFSISRTIGFTNTLEYMLMEPAWIKDMALSYARLMANMLDLLQSEGIHWDGIFMDEDLAYKNGPMFSPECYQELIMPAHQILFDCVHSHAGYVIHHSDGDMHKLLPLLLKAGIDVSQPLQNTGNQTAESLVNEFGKKLVYMGNINVRVLETNDPIQIENEVKRKLSVFPRERYIIDSDGSITPKVSWDSFRWCMACIEKYGTYQDHRGV